MKKEMISNLGVSALCESMMMMLQAGIQTDEAISLLLEDNRGSGVLAKALRQADGLVASGETVSQAFRETGVFPDYMIRMIAMGERSGQMEKVFGHLAEYYAQQDTMSQQLWSVVRYPAVMLVVILAVLAVMLTKVLPVFSGVYESLTGSLFSSAYRYIEVAYGFCWAALGVMLVLAVLLIGGQLLWHTGKGRKLMQKLLEKLPCTKRLMGSLGLYRFMVSLQLLMAAGETQDLAVEESTKLVQCGIVEEKLRQCEKRMLEGEGIAQAAYHVELLEPVYGRMLLAGAKSGNLSEVLGRLAALLREDVLHRVEILVSVLNPVLSGVMMLTVGAALVSVMLPLIGMMSSIG